MRAQASIEQMITYGILVTSVLIIGIALFRSGVFSPKTPSGEMAKQNLGAFYIRDYSYQGGKYQISLGVIRMLVLKNITVNENYFEEFNGLKKSGEVILIVGNTSMPPPLKLKVYYEIDEFPHIGVTELPERG